MASRFSIFGTFDLTQGNNTTRTQRGFVLRVAEGRKLRKLDGMETLNKDSNPFRFLCELDAVCKFR